MKTITALLCLILFFQIHLFAQIDSLLFESIKRDNIAQVDSLIKAGISLDQKDDAGIGVLMWSCYYADSALVALLLENGAKQISSSGMDYSNTIILETPVKGWFGNPQAVAAGRGNTNVLKHLLEVEKRPIGEAPVHPSNDSLSGWTALMHAVYNEQATSIKLLLEKGADIQKENNLGQNAIQITDNVLLKKVLENKDFALLDDFYQYQKWNVEMANAFHKRDLKTAIDFAESNLKLIERIYGKDHAVYGSVLSDLGLLHLTFGAFEKALPLNLEALENARKTLGEEHPQYGLRCNNLARVYVKIGDKEKALEHYQNALKSFGKHHAYYPRLLSNIAELYDGLGEHNKAVPLHLEAIEYTEKNYGKKHIQYALKLNNFGASHMSVKDHEKALPLFLEAKKITEETLGKEHSYNGVVLNNLASVYRETGDYDQALTAYSEALNIKEKIFGKEHPSYGFQINNIAHLYVKMKDYDTAAFYFKELIDNASHTINTSFHNIPSKDQFSWKQEYLNYQSIVNSFFYNQYPDSIPEEIVNYNIQLKGLIAGNEAKNSSLSHLKSYVDWLTLKQNIGKELSKPIVKMNPDLDQWKKEANRLEATLLTERKFSDQYKKITVKGLQEKLNANEAIVDFVDFDQEDSTRLYVAYIILPESKAIKSIPLFTEKELQTLIKEGAQNKSIGQLYAHVERGLTPGKKRNKSGTLRFIWEQLLPHLEECTKLYISPTGLLNKINLGAIAIGKDTLALDRFDLAYHNNLRSLFSSNDAKDTDQAFLLVGGVNYDHESETLDQLRSKGETDVLQQLRSATKESWPYLPGTATEIVEVSELLKKSEIKHTLLMKEKAKESTIKNILAKADSPSVIHFSTHGFFFPDISENNNNKNSFKNSDNPMIRSGLILSGGNYAWKKGEVPPGEKEDGILTAYEVANLDLSNTDLVVLSACETGLGDIRDSEGVIGLQHAFKVAGARYVIMSLWQVPDEATQELMTVFYDKWLSQKMDIKTAFSEAQKSIRSDYDDPYFWAGFVLIE